MARPRPLQTEHRFVEHVEVDGLELPVACDDARLNVAVVRRRWVRSPAVLLRKILGRVGNGDGEDVWEDTRTSDRGQYILDLEAELHGDLYRRLEPVVLEVNERYFGLDLDYWQVMRLNRYLPGNGGHEQHTDYGGREPAKLAFSILLHEPEEGGETFIEYFDEQPVGLRAGDGVIFPGYEPHEVRAVTAGERISLTGWLGGPPLR